MKKILIILVLLVLIVIQHNSYSKILNLYNQSVYESQTNIDNLSYQLIQCKQLVREQ